MNYIELINAFWIAHEEFQFNVTEIAMYFHLLKICNSLRWKNPFDRNNRKIMSDLDISYPTMDRARKRLKECGLINFKTINGNPNARYIISQPDLKKFFQGNDVGSNAGAGSGSNQSTVGGTNTGNDVDKVNVNQTKLNETIYRSFLHLQMSYAEFVELINIGYSKVEIDTILDRIQNHKQNKKYISLYLTAKDWLNNERDKPKKVETKQGEAKKFADTKIKRAIEAFETYKQRGAVTDWDNEVFDLLLSKKIIEVNGDLMAQMAKGGKLPEAKQAALMEFFNQLAEESKELKDLLK